MQPEGSVHYIEAVLALWDLQQGLSCSVSEPETEP